MNRLLIKVTTFDQELTKTTLYNCDIIYCGSFIGSLYPVMSRQSLKIKINMFQYHMWSLRRKGMQQQVDDRCHPQGCCLLIDSSPWPVSVFLMNKFSKMKTRGDTYSFSLRWFYSGLTGNFIKIHAHAIQYYVSLTYSACFILPSTRQTTSILNNKLFPNNAQEQRKMEF